MKKSCLALLLCAAMMSTACGSSASNSAATAGQETVVKDNREGAAAETEEAKAETEESSETAKGDEITEADFEVTEYSYASEFSTYMEFVVVKNNGNKAVTVTSNGTAKDADGKILGASDLVIDVVGPGETSIGYFFFDEVDGVESVDYELSYEPSVYYYPVVGNLSVEQNLNDRNLTVTITNNGKTIAEFVEAYALFLDKDGNVINYSSTYITDDNGCLNPGVTLSGQLDCYEEYDHVEMYLTGRSDGNEVEVAETSVEDLLETTEYMYEDMFSTTYYVVVKNNDTKAHMIGGNATAKDADGNTIGAGDFSIDVLGPQETSIGYFYFSDVKDVATVDYKLTVSDSYYKPVISDISVEESINSSNVVVTATNNGEAPALFVEAYALFMDKDNNVVYANSGYLVDNDSELKPGATLSEQLDVYDTDFDRVEVYLTGRAEK